MVLVVTVNCSTQTNNHKNDVMQVELIIVFPQAPEDGEGQGNPEGVLQSMVFQRVGHA